ncbi:DUF692 family multinuclear iron-containing protein [Stigmatella aurantiaca]|uniref:Conserved uncharacterized protein n=2 Tax=Stigmatella aurantiaca (strain DW4/3-1) TaxID=378806 RepID=E3FYU0_STIAD|nr:DUF692 family multinuclear iron-containing protein [Stigmatella aurantiaca]ADO72403.1 conserved uncharacterized protein [Stigmatella aurantiaca DW4/3-1]
MGETTGSGVKGRSQEAWTLPWRGLGLSSNLNASDPPHPYRLLADAPGLFDFVEYSAPLSLEETKAHATLYPEMLRNLGQVPVLFHPVHLNLYGPERETPQALAELEAHARAVGSAWVGNDVGWWHAGGQPFPGYLYIPPPLTPEGLEDCVAHALHVQAALNRPLALENPAVFARRGDMHVLDFMAGLHARTGLPLLVDVGHLLSYQLSAGLPLEAGWDGFPFEQVIELHLAGGVVTRRGNRRFYVDDHTQPVRDELFAMLETLLSRCTSLRAVTFEGDGHPPEVAERTLQRLRKWIPADPRPPLRLTPREVQVPPPPNGSRPWELFELGYGARPPEPGDDPEGSRAETDFRLAVVAEQLDRAFPLTRLLMAGTRDELRAFTASPEFRELFLGEGRSLDRAFLAFARRRLRAQPDEGCSAALSFEVFLPSLAQRPHAPPGPGEVGLAADTWVGVFPADLSEVVYTARALRRHLTGRAWACELLELSGLESLAQTARRVTLRPWRFAVRRRAGRWDVQTAPASLLALLRTLASGPVPEASLSPEGLAEALGRGLARRGG